MYRNGGNRSARRIPVRVVEREHIPVPPTGQSGELSMKETRESSLPISDEIISRTAAEPDWQSLALRLQADVDNFRKRQTRRADEAIAAERQRLLRLVLSLADNLGRALSHDGRGDESLREGVELTYRELMRLLEAEGVTRIETVGRPFTPELHEAVATVAADVQAGTVVEELEKGYKLDDKLLRPARVVVAA